jgi:DNA-binding CsgD family transcriptional regulator/tetratricopeptide (TPR) repeat protein
LRDGDDHERQRTARLIRARPECYVPAMDLVERGALLASLRAIVDDARAGAGSVVLLGGEAGVGKTSLVRALTDAEGSRVRVLWGACEPLVTPEPLGPFHDMAPLAAIIASRPDRVGLLKAMLDELRTTPSTLIVVDDAHWADEASLDALRFLGRRVHETPGVLLVTYRDEEAPATSLLRSVLGDLATAPSHRRLVVPPLSADAVAELAADAPVDPGRLHAATGGNAFFVTEVLAAPGWTVPPTVTDAVIARVSRFDATARNVLEVVSLSPGGLEPSIAIELSGGDMDALDTCLDQGMLLAGPGRVTFRHELARLAVEGQVPAGRRRRLHRALLEQLEGRRDGEASRLAHHADGAGDAEAVLRYVPIAAQEASRRGAHRAAADHYTRAVAAAESTRDERLADLVSALADERIVYDDPSDVLVLRERALELRRRAGDRRAEARELIELGRLANRLGDSPEGDRRLADAVAILESLPPGPELALAYASMAYGADMNGAFEETLRLATRAIELAEAGAEAMATTLALRCRAEALIFLGQVDEGLEAYDEGRRVALAADDQDGAMACILEPAIDLMTLRRYDEARPRIEEAIEFGRSADLDVRVSVAESSLADLQFQAGRWVEAERMTRRLLAEHAGKPLSVLGDRTLLARIQVRRGEAAGTATLDELWTLAQRYEFPYLWDITAGRAEAAWLAGRSGDIPEIVGDVYKRLNRGLQWDAGHLAQWLWRAGALKEPPADVAEPYRLLMAGEWRAAADAWERIGCPYERADALAEGDEAAMREALTIFSRLGAAPAADRLRSRMRRLGIRNVPARPHRSTRAAPAQLTARQLEILKLLEAGLTNAEIGGRLFISERTADHHVSAILAKLGARSRTEAASTARKMGIAAAES